MIDVKSRIVWKKDLCYWIVGSRVRTAASPVAILSNLLTGEVRVYLDDESFRERNMLGSSVREDVKKYEDVHGSL